VERADQWVMDRRGSRPMADWWAVLTFKIFVHTTVVSPSATSFVIVTFLQVLKAASMKMTAFRDTTPCGFVKVDRRFRGA
jgi:hypothetical protein